MRRTILLFVSLLLVLCSCATAKETEQKFVVIACKNEYITDGIVTSSDYYSSTYNNAGLVTYMVPQADGRLQNQNRQPKSETPTEEKSLKGCLSINAMCAALLMWMIRI